MIGIKKYCLHYDYSQNILIQEPFLILDKITDVGETKMAST